MADGAVNFLLDKLTSILLQKASLLGDAHNEIKEIKDELESMRSFLKDAERRIERSELVETWVSQVREVAYEVEDIIDEFMHHKDREKHKSGFKGITNEIVHFPKNITARHQIASKLPKIKVKVREISDRSKRYGFDNLDEGTSKTTLATRVYNDQRIKQQFGCCAWISVSQTDDIHEILRSMVRDFFGTKQLELPRNFGSMNNMQLMAMLIDYLHQKRYVVVLDDQHLSEADTELITLNPLQENDAWALFCKKAFWNEPGHCCPKELEPLAHDIVKKCEGLPLAIVAIGGLMCSRSKIIGEWKKVYESLNWQLSNNPMLEQIKRKKLIRLWVAEGFVKERKGNTMEEVAEEHLTDLILRSMIQVSETNAAGRVKTCRVHDVMCKLAMTISEKENFCKVYDGREGKFQRLSVYDRGENIRLSRAMSHHLRSFFVFKTDMCTSFSLDAVLSKFKLLRVLNLQGVPVEKIPSKLGRLFNLRYLNLRDTKISKLPKSIERLWNLQTLDVRNTNVRRLPSGISKLTSLRHLYMYCNNGQNSKASNIANNIQAPAGIWDIRCLQTLTCIDAEEELIQQVGNLTELRRLEITKLRSVQGPKLCTSIQKMKNLLCLGVTATNEEELQLEALSLPPLYLQKLELVGRLDRLPQWFGSLSNLTHLSLGMSCLQDDMIVSLHILPALVFLELKKAYNGKLLHFEAGWFLKLSKLKIVELKQLDRLVVEEGALPTIRELNLICCLELKTLPQGVEHLTSLQKLHLEEMPEEFIQMLQNDTNHDQSKETPRLALMLVMATQMSAFGYCQLSVMM
uniref:Rx N-terminal domain-containing protein n=1 Tax=Fagus sylvatica TaxID=28930 RepID=A0A2N9E741_FAGSY